MHWTRSGTAWRAFTPNTDEQIEAVEVVAKYHGKALSQYAHAPQFLLADRHDNIAAIDRGSDQEEIDDMTKKADHEAEVGNVSAEAMEAAEVAAQAQEPEAEAPASVEAEAGEVKAEEPKAAAVEAKAAQSGLDVEAEPNGCTDIIAA